MGAGSAGGSATGPGPEDPGPSHAPASDTPPPDLKETFRQVAAAGRSSASAFADAGKAFRSLAVADISLARSAFGRSLAFTGLAIAFGASAWLLLMGTLIAVLRGQFGLGWTTAMLSCALLSLVVAGLAAWAAMHYFEHTRLKATRRQLARLGLGELADFTPAPGSARSAKDVEESDVTRHGEPVKDSRGVPVTPP